MSEQQYFKTDIFLYGLPGSGKTVSLTSLLQFPNLKLRVLSTEQNSLIGLRNGLKKYGIKPEPGQLVIQQVVENRGETVLKSEVTRTVMYHNLDEKEALAQKISSGERKKFAQFLNVQKSLINFVGIDFATKEPMDLGNIGSWDSNTVFAVDGISAVTRALFAETTGDRIAVNRNDYGTVQKRLETFTTSVLTSTKASVIMLGHAKRAADEVTGIENITPDLPGIALSSSYGQHYTDSIYADRNGNNFYWVGYRNGVLTSPRSLPAKDRLAPDFANKDYSFFQDPFSL